MRLALCRVRQVRHMQIASMVIEEGGEARTINFCNRRYNEKTYGAGQTVTEVEGMERGCGKAGSSWQVVEDFRK